MLLAVALPTMHIVSLHHSLAMRDAALDKTLASPPPPPPPPPSPAKTKPRIFYFGITHGDEKYAERAIASDQTWARKCCPRGMMWYSTKPDARLRNVTVLVPPQGLGYYDVYHRVRMIWKHVFEHFPGYDWYVRAWDDNYLFPEVFERLAEQHDPTELVEIGKVFHRNHTMWSPRWCTGEVKRNRTGHLNAVHQPIDFAHVTCPVNFMSGGCTSMLSAAALRKLGPALYTTCSDTTLVQEDVSMATCLKALGVRYEDYGGFLSNSIRPLGLHPIFPSDISCKRKIVVSRTGALADIASLHCARPPRGCARGALTRFSICGADVKYGGHQNISRAESTPCNASIAVRDSEVAVFGYYKYRADAEKAFRTSVCVPRLFYF